MTGPASSRTRPPLRPLRGAEWFGARLTLAIRRTKRFTQWWLGLGGALTVIALLLPVAAGDPQADTRNALDRAAADSLRTGARVQQLQSRLRDADSAIAEGIAAIARVSRPRRATASASASARDPRVTAFDRALIAARDERTVEAYLALADDALVRYGPRMRAFADSLRGTRDALEVRRLGLTIIQIAENRRAELGPLTVPRVSGIDLAPPADTTELRNLSDVLRDSLTNAVAQHRVSTAEVERLVEEMAARRATVPPLSAGLVFLSILVFGLALRVGLALTQEMGNPTIAHMLEAERAIGAPGLALVRDPIPEGPLRFRPSGVDPFRVLYLGLTSTGTRTRAVLVTGEDAIVVAAVGARLAIAAAADHRTTLVAELDPEQIAMARLFRDHAEPGFTDAMAGLFTWREVARAVGSSDGLTIQMIPGGTARDPLPDDAAEEVARAGFSAFRNGFEFTILAVTLRDLGLAHRFLPGAPVVLCGTVGETLLARFTADGARVQSEGVPLQSLVLWDAPRPILPSRAELAAQLSKRRGRTPGGSFKAVQEATKKPV